jgi:molybdopterin-containing oxidoreductase family membrane subunit
MSKISIKSSVRKPLITGGKTIRDITRDICKPFESNPSILWISAFLFSFFNLCVGAYTLFMTVWEGIGMWGLNKTVGWAWDITNFVWWVGIGHAGTLISAILLLFRQRWRMSINRAAEAMTIFAVICAAMFPLLHMGRLQHKSQQILS